MHLIFDVNHQDLREKDRLVVGGHVVDSTEHTTYSSTIKTICETNAIYICEEFIRTHGSRYCKLIMYYPMC